MNIWILTRTFAHGVWHVPASRLTTPTPKERTADHIHHQEIEASSKLFIVSAITPENPFCHHELTTALLKYVALSLVCYILFVLHRNTFTPQQY